MTPSSEDICLQPIQRSAAVCSASGRRVQPMPLIQSHLTTVVRQSLAEHNLYTMGNQGIDPRTDEIWLAERTAPIRPLMSLLGFANIRIVQCLPRKEDFYLPFLRFQPTQCAGHSRSLFQYDGEANPWSDAMRININ